MRIPANRKISAIHNGDLTGLNGLPEPLVGTGVPVNPYDAGAILDCSEPLGRTGGTLYTPCLGQ